MCVVALALNAHPRWRIVLAGNRDEFHSRPSAPLARWEDNDRHIIAGRDLQSGGTWLGISEEGRLAVVTNIRTGQMPDPAKLSRGALIADFLHGKSMFDSLSNYNPFSMFAVDQNTASLVANRPDPVIEELPDGIHSLSNGLPGDAWPRREWLHRALGDWLATEAPDPEQLFTLLADETPLTQDDSHAPIFIRDEHYGTRCSTIVAVDNHGQSLIIEQRFGPNGIEQGETRIDFNWTAPSPTAP